MDFDTFLRENLKKFNIEPDEEQCGYFKKYTEELRKWNEKINLTAITEPEEIIVKHFTDSLSIMPILPKGKYSLIDVGTGAGFPGIPLKIMNRDISLTLLDSLEKRIKFLDFILENINADNYKCVHCRAEDGGHNPEFREKYDVCTARAVAKLPVLLEYCLPFVKTGGIFVAMKGNDTQEISQARTALDILGGEIVDVREIKLGNEGMNRTIITVKKYRQISTKYPRKAGTPSKNPLI